MSSAAKATPRPVERQALPDLDDAGQAGEGEEERDPDPPAHHLVHRIPRPEGDEERRDVLDQERDSDRQPVDREEVEELHERQAEHAEEEEEAPLLAPEAQALGGDQCQSEQEPDRGAGRADLAQPQRAEP